MLLVFLVFVVLLAGVVAYAADNIGRRVGRKHLRLFGLRPKTTALLVAVGAGMGISLLSLLAFFVLNRQAIRNIEQADTLRQELGELRRDVTAVRGDLGHVTQQRDAANLRAGAARSEAEAAQTQLQDASARLERAQQQTRTLQTQAGELGRKVSELTTLRAGLEAQAEQNQRLLAASKSGLTAAQGQLEQARTQVKTLDAENTQAQQQADAAQAAARAAQAKAQDAQQRVSGLQSQIATLDASRRSVTAQRDAAAASLRAVQVQRDVVQRSVASLRTDVANLRAQSQNLQAQNAGLLTQNAQFLAQNTQLRADSAQLQADNDSLRRNLSDSQATVTRLEDEYSRATSELSATRNAPTIYPRNAIVYGGLLASVRNLDDFLAQAGQAAAAKGVRATPAVQLSAGSRRSLEATLRGLNTSTFVLCRASGNASAALPVDLSCEARNNALLYPQGSVIRRGTISLGGGDEALRSQVRDLLGDAVLDLTSRGVPLEYVLSGNLDTAQLITALGKLADAGKSSAVVGVMPRADVKPGSRVSLYAALLP